MSAKKKTQELLRFMAPVEALQPDEDNPNAMSDREFDLLVSNLEETGFTDPALVYVLDKNDIPAVKKAPEQALKDGVKLGIVGGHHRVEAAKYLGMDKVPVTCITDPTFNKERKDMQLIRMNVIHGKMAPEKFVKLVERYQKDYAEDIIQEMFGFADEAEFRKLIDKTAKSLPKEMQQQFKDAAKEIKTVDGLTKLLNKMFATHGDTLPHGYMVMDYGGQDSVWLHLSKKTFKATMLIGDFCIENQMTMDDVVGKILQLIASGQAPDLVQKVLDGVPTVELPENMVAMPTKDHIKNTKDAA